MAGSYEPPEATYAGLFTLTFHTVQDLSLQRFTVEQIGIAQAYEISGCCVKGAINR